MPRIPVSTDSILAGTSLLLFVVVLLVSNCVGLGDKFSLIEGLLAVGVLVSCYWVAADLVGLRAVFDIMIF